MTENGQSTSGDVSPPALTEILLEARSGQPDALVQMFPVIYDELHRIAHAQLVREPQGHTLNTTALVHEAYIRLVDITRVEWRDRVHFLSMAARVARILIDHARRHRRARRGGGARAITLDEALVAADQQADTLLALDLALERLAALNERLVRVVECRFFAGLTEDETAQALQVTARL